MTKYLVTLLISTVCELLILSVIRALLLVERQCIIEVGYRSQSKKTTRELPLWDKLLNWSLCKKAKINTKVVWFYFTCNLFLVISVICSAVSACILVFSCEAKEVMLYQLEYFLCVIFTWGIIHFFLDLFFLPSEQKRYGISAKSKGK